MLPMPPDPIFSENEIRRQLVHGSMAIPILALPFISKEVAIGIATLAVLQNLFILPHLNITRKLFRPGEGRWGGIVLFPLSVFLLLLCTPDSSYPWLPATAWIVLAVGDSTATIFGKRWGKNKIPGCSGKTIEGSSAFLLSAFCASFALLLALNLPVDEALLLAAVASSAGAIAEAVPFPWDDNLTVPAISALALGPWV